MGLLGGVFNHRESLREYSCKHDVDGRANRNHIKINVRTGQAVRGVRMDIAALPDGNGCAKRLKALNMLIDRTDAAKVAAAGHGDFRMMVFAEQRADQVIRRTDFSHQFIGNLSPLHTLPVQFHRRGIGQADRYAKLPQDFKL